MDLALTFYGVFRSASVALLVLCLVSGCATRNTRDVSNETDWYQPAACHGSPPALFSRIELNSLIRNFIGEFCSPDGGSRNGEINPEEAVVVPDFVDINSYQANSSGVILGEITRSAVSVVCRQPVRQVDLSKSLKLNEFGLSALTRDAEKIAFNGIPVRWGYVGTYAELPRKLILTLREIDFSSGVISRVVSKELVYGCYWDGTRNIFTYSVN